jgi:hypothetical protein
MREAGKALLAGALAAAVLARPVSAHGIGGAGATGSAPLWVVLLVGGAVVAGSFLFATLLTDHEAIRAINQWRLPLPATDSLLERGADALAAAGVLALAVVIVVGLVGPTDARSNLAVLVVFGLWWAGYTMSVYLLGDTWGAVNPWRALSRLLPRLDDRALPENDDWPAALGLLGFIWLEVVSPVADDPRLLALVVIVYTVVTLVAAAVYGEAWFDTVDPLSRVFACFGHLAPLERTDDGLALRLPGSAAADWRRGEGLSVPLVVALLWGTTFDGLVATPPWGAVAGPLVDAGVPAAPLYLVGLLGGFGLFVSVYRGAARWSRRTAESTLSTRYVAAWFVPALLPIAAGYHVAHFLGYLLRLAPSLGVAATSPLSPPQVDFLGLPGWYGSLQLVFVLAGHVFAIWVAHGLSFDLFPGRLQPIRSQYPFTAVMVLYTMTSMWIIAQPYAAPPGV